MVDFSRIPASPNKSPKLPQNGNRQLGILAPQASVQIPGDRVMKLITDSKSYQSIDANKAQLIKYGIAGPNHAMVVIGYKEDPRDPNSIVAWKIKNSWGKDEDNEEKGLLLDPRSAAVIPRQPSNIDCPIAC